MDQAMKIEHAFAEYKEEKKAQNEAPKMATICVGSTGTGKSSLINLFCTNKVKVGHGTKSETPGSLLIDSTDTGYWLDSQGANDSSGVDDEKVLTDILKQLYDKNVSSIKVVWCVSGDMCREKQEFQTQARFIKALGNSVWSSCLIIVKKGEPQPESMGGVLAAARRFGANICKSDYKHLFGFSGLEFGDLSKDRLLKMINKIKDDANRKEALLESGYLINTEIVTHVAGKLSKLPSINIHFENKQCSKCGVKGDPRFVYAPCHTESEEYHPNAVTIPYHTLSLERVHPFGIEKYHPGGIETPISTEWYHLGSWGYYGRKNGERYGHYSCCRPYRMGLIDMYPASSPPTGCTQKVNTGSRRWTCCYNSPSSSGCTQRYRCCGGSPTDDGCRREYKCCHTQAGNAGCHRKHTCCDKGEGSNGCKDRCQSCHKEWGSSIGCIQTTKKQ